MNGRRNGGEDRGSSLQWVKRVTMWSGNDSNKEEKKGDSLMEYGVERIWVLPGGADLEWGDV